MHTLSNRIQMSLHVPSWYARAMVKPFHICTPSCTSPDDGGVHLFQVLYEGVVCDRSKVVTWIPGLGFRKKPVFIFGFIHLFGHLFCSCMRPE